MGWHSFWGHLSTITRHRHAVIRHCRKAGIFWQGLRHDLSKYSPTEFWQGVRYYEDGKRSPNEAEREAYGYSLAPDRNAQKDGRDARQELPDHYHRR